MKLALFLCLISVSLFAQKKKEEADSKSLLLKYGADSLDLEFDSLWQSFKRYNIDDCNCAYLPKPGEKVSERHPYAKYINDSTLWEWVDVDFGGGWKQKVYELKPQYKDTLKRNDGSYIDVRLWIKYPGWKKPEETPKKKETL